MVMKDLLDYLYTRLAMHTKKRPRGNTRRYLPNQQIPLWKKLYQIYLAFSNPFDSISAGMGALGDIIALDLGLELYVAVCNPSILSILNKDASWNFTGKAPAATVDAHPMRQASGDFILLTEGYYHKHFRGQEMKEFTQSKINDYIKVFTENLEKLEETWQINERIDYGSELYGITFHSLCKGLFGIRLSPNEMSKYQMVRKKALSLSKLHMLLGSLATSQISPFAIGFHQALNGIRTDVQKSIEKAEGCPFATGPLDEETNTQNENSSGKFGKNKIVDEILGYVAASESTSITACWAIRILLTRPCLVEKIRKEADEVIGKRDAACIRHRDLRFTRQVVLETLRLYPPFPIIRTLTIEELIIDGFMIPPKTWILVPIFNIHRDPRWFENPLEFIPERWNDNPYGVDPTMSFIPFGFGHHRCIAWELAIAELSVQIAYLFHRYDVESASSMKTRPVGEIPYRIDGINLRPKDALLLSLSARSFRH
jgi:cytochrome P450